MSQLSKIAIIAYNSIYNSKILLIDWLFIKWNYVFYSRKISEIINRSPNMKYQWINSYIFQFWNMIRILIDEVISRRSIKLDLWCKVCHRLYLYHKIKTATINSLQKCISSLNRFCFAYQIVITHKRMI